MLPHGQREPDIDRHRLRDAVSVAVGEVVAAKALDCPTRGKEGPRISVKDITGPCGRFRSAA